MNKIIDGKKISQSIKDHLKNCIETLKTMQGKEPNLAIVLVGDNPASLSYVNNKIRSAKQIGIEAKLYKLPTTTSQEDVLYLIDTLNNDENINGIIVQLPLPEKIKQSKILKAIDPKKDVDGFHPTNKGYLFIGNYEDEEGKESYTKRERQKAFYPSTPIGIIRLIKEVLEKDLSGKHAVVVGRSNIVGRPTAQLLLKENCTTTIAHRKTENLKEITKQADILISATGQLEMIKSDFIKQGATLIDVGITRVGETPSGKSILKGDIDFDDCIDKAGFITPVPGGVGPMTVTILLENTLRAFLRQNKLYDFEQKELD